MPISFFEDICGWLGGTKRSYLMEWTLARSMKAVVYNHKLECPLKRGEFSLNYRNISLNEKFPAVPIFPSGQYIFEVELLDGQHSTSIAKMTSYFAISDHRIEKYDDISF